MILARRNANIMRNGKVYKVQVLDENRERVLWEEGPYATLGTAKGRATTYKRRDHYQTKILVLEGEWTEA